MSHRLHHIIYTTNHTSVYQVWASEKNVEKTQSETENVDERQQSCFMEEEHQHNLLALALAPKLTPHILISNQ